MPEVPRSRSLLAQNIKQWDVCEAGFQQVGIYDATFQQKKQAWLDKTISCGMEWNEIAMGMRNEPRGAALTFVTMSCLSV